MLRQSRLHSRLLTWIHPLTRAKYGLALTRTQIQSLADKPPGNPSPEAINRLINEYGVEKSQAIIIRCDMITIGNLLGNSISSFLSRLQGIPPEHGSLGFELFVFVFGGFWMDHLMRKKGRKLF